MRAGLDETVDRLVNYEAISNLALDERIASMHLVLKQPSAQVAIDNVRLWLTRMIYSARPLEERMTFFWHNHFATSFVKVGESDLMRVQTDLFRRYAIGNFTQLCVEVAKDCAMLFWLDNFTSAKEHPNENFGRELLELFTLGRGHYAESDVIAAARAFTGWSLDLTVYPVQFKYIEEWHDHGQKTFLGHSGDLIGDDVARIACSQFDHGRLIASKLFAYFAYENPEQELVDRLARIYLDAGTELRPLVTAILKSPEMYSSRAIWTKVKSPIDHIVIACRQLQVQNEIKSIREHLILQGQLPYEPPSVAGWAGGMTWIMAAALLSRMNFSNVAAAELDPLAFGIPSIAPDIVDLYLRRLGPLHVDELTRRELIAFVAPGDVLPQGQALLTRLRGLAHMILSLPEWQML
jgi:uncharacterized protein (DUF1800 family)